MAEGQQVAGRHSGDSVGGGQRGHQDARDGRTGGLLQNRPQGPLHAVGRQQVLGRQDPRQDGGVGGEEERSPDAEHKSPKREMPELQQARHGQPADGGNDGEVGALDRDDQEPLGQAVRGDPAGQEKRHQPDAARRSHERELQGAAAEVDHLVDHRHGPHPGTEDGDRQRRDQHAVLPVREGAEGSQGGHAPSLATGPGRAASRGAEPAPPVPAALSVP